MSNLSDSKRNIMGSSSFGAVDTVFVPVAPANTKIVRGIHGCAVASDRG